MSNVRSLLTRRFPSTEAQQATSTPPHPALCVPARSARSAGRSSSSHCPTTQFRPPQPPVTPEKPQEAAGAHSDMSDLSGLCGDAASGTPFVAGTLRGYRAWRPAQPLGAKVPQGALPLASVTQPQVIWTPTLSARCIPPDVWAFRCPPPVLPAGHTSPSVRCSCGIYAWYDPDDAGILSAQSLRRGPGVRPHTHGRPGLSRRVNADRCDRHAEPPLRGGLRVGRHRRYRRRPAIFSTTTHAMI